MELVLMPNAKLFWFKLKTSFITSNAVNYMMTLEHGSDYVLMYQALTLATLNTEGKLRYILGKKTIKMTIDYLEKSLRFWNVDLVRLGIDLFIELELLKVDSDGFLYIVDFDKNIGSEWKSTQADREKKREKSEKKHGSNSYQSEVGNLTQSEVGNLTQSRVVKKEKKIPELDLDLDKDLDKEVESKKLELLNTSFDKSDTSDKSDKATRPLPIGPATGFLEALIRKKYITQNDPEMDDYNYLFEDLINEFKDYSLIYQCLSYVISYSKNSKIDNRLAYLKTAITDGLKKVTQFSDGNTLEDVMKKFMHDHDIKLEDISHVN